MDVTKIDARIAALMVPRLFASIPDELSAATSAHASTVLSELHAIAAYRDVDELLHAQTCIVFAMISPRTKFEKNVRATRRFMHAFDRTFNSVDDVYQCITDNGADSWFSAGNAARSLFASHAWLKTMTLDDMNKPALLALNRAGIIKGMARKTAAMAVALFDPYAPVFTLDTHMMRGMLIRAGMNPVGDLNINDSAYDVLEAAMIEIVNQCRPNVDTPMYFLFQWALWNRWGFQDTHVSHVAIFSDTLEAAE